MNFTDYYPIALETAATMPDLRSELRHCLLGMVTEFGEFMSEVKRHVAYGREITTEMNTHMKEELGDFCWYIPVGMRACGVRTIEPSMPEGFPGRGSYFESLGDLAIPGALMIGSVAALIVEMDEGDYSFDPEFIAQLFCGALYLVEQGAVLLGTTGDQLRIENIQKLRDKKGGRYKEGFFSATAAEARADKAGVDHRNS